MLLTSWVESMRVAFEKSRKATLNPRRRLQLRSGPSMARQRIQRRIAVEQLEDRTLLTSLIINQITPGLGLTLNNSVLDPDADGISNFDTILFEDLTIDTTTGSAVSVDLDNLTFTDPFQILFDNVSINADAGVGVDIQLSNLLADTIAVDSSTITGGLGNAFNVDLTNVTLNEFNIIDSTLSGQAGAGVTLGLSASTVEETSVRRSTIDGVAIDVADGSVLRHTTMADNTIAGTSGNDGVSVNIVDSIAEELRLTNNNSIQGVAINVDDTAAGGAALLTELFIHSNLITGNTAGDGVRLDLNNVDQFVSITGNTISSNSGDGIVFTQTDGDLSGDISDNSIANNSGHGIYFTPSTTNPVPTGDGAPGVPPYAGIPGPTDKIDFSSARNEVQLITFAGVPTGGTFTISYTGGDGITETTAGILSTATASQVKQAMVNAFSGINFDDILVNGNFQDGFEVEFVNAAGGQNQNLLTLNASGFNSTPASVTVTQDTLSNVSEVQHLELSATPAFGTFQINFLGSSVVLPYTSMNSTDLQNELNLIALTYMDPNGNLPFQDNPIQVVSTGTGFDIIFLDSRSMHDLDIPQITVDTSGLNLFLVVNQGPAELNPNKPVDQIITFQDVDGNNVTPTGGSFTLTFQGETTNAIPVSTNPATMIANIDAALEALFSSTNKTGTVGDFIVSGDFTSGFTIEFNEYQHLAMLGFNDPTFGSFQLTFLGQNVTLPYTDSIPSITGAANIQTALNGIANGLGYTGNPVSVTVSGNGYDIVFLDSGTLANVDIAQIATNADRMRFNIIMGTPTQGSASVNEIQSLDFENTQGAFPFTFAANNVDITNPPTGAAFTLTFQGEETAGIIIDTDPAVTAANIDAALEALSIATSGDDFDVTGDYVNGFRIEFQGDFELANVPLIVANVYPLDVTPSTAVGNFNLATINPITGDPALVEPNVSVTTSTTTEGVGDNEIQTISFPNSPGGGTFTLDTVNSTNGPVVLDFDATAAEVQAALESLDAIGAGNVLVTGSALTGGFDVEFIGDFRANSPGDTILVDDSAILVVVPTVTTIAEGTTINEVQEISVAGTPTAGDFTLTFDGATTGAIAYNADAAAIIAALVALPTLNPGDVLVRGTADTGFEIEYVGNLATINTPQIVVDDTNLTGASMTVKTTTVGGYLRGIRGNSITGNFGAGIEIDLEMYTSFYGEIVGNTISSNQTQGINLVAADPTTLKSVDFSLSVDGNTMDDNRGAGVAVTMQDTAAGDISITNNTITGSRNDNNVTTPFAGDAIYVDLIGTDVSFEAFNQLRDLTIDGNYLGTDANSTAGLGNAGNGIGIHIEESTIIDRTEISNNVIANNTGDGVNFHREDDARVGRAVIDPIVGEERAVMIHDNIITTNSDGIDILAQNGNLTTTDFEIKDNIISTNIRDGLSLHAEADATIFADVINNQLTLNNRNGIELTTRTTDTSYFGTDRRDVSGTWIQNTISNNGYHGIRISGRIGNRNMLFIGLDGVDPITGEDRGNMIEGNARDGIQIAANQDRIEGNVKIANNSVLSNSTGGIELTGESLNSSLDNNLIAFNTGKGVDINSNSQTIFLRENIITENTADGLEILAANRILFTEDGVVRDVRIGGNALTSLTAIGNFIDNNGGRGVDLQTEEQADSDIVFGDGTEKGANRIVSNALEGFYVVTTASRGQNQDADSLATLDATGAVESSHADMVLNINTNYIQDNGVNSDFSSTGLVLRIGTMAGEHTDWFSHAPGTDAGTGAEGSDFGDGRSNVSVTNNEFEGNFGEDFYVESFTSTVDPNTTTDNWDANANPPFRVTGSYEGDPLARLNLVFEGNTGNGINVVNFGAYYDNSEPVFKSRLANGSPAPNPDGPFNSATRRRNAQRVASRTNLAPFSAPNAAPTAVGTVATAFLSSPGGPIQITTTTAHGLTSGSIVEITGVRSDELGFSLTSSIAERLSPVNGVFYIDVIDAFNFTLRSTEGSILGNVRQNFGTWSYNEQSRLTGSFLYPGMGVSTFRIAQGFDGVGNGFQSGDSFLTEWVYGTTFGEENFDWDTWVPDDDSFLLPSTSTFLTADLSVAVPDPTTGAITDPITISFTEDVNGVDISDFILWRDNVAVALNSSMLTQIDARTFELDLSSVTDVEGEYQLRLINDGSITDAKYISPYSPLFGNFPTNYLMFGDVERFTVDTTAPTADIVDVSPDPRSEAAGEVVVNFSEDVQGVDLSDFTVTIDGGTPINLASTPATLTQVTGSQFILDISKVTSLSGNYVLTLNAAGSSITDQAGNALAANASDSWLNDTLSPIAQFVNVVDPVAPGTDPGFTVTLNFSEAVTGLALSDFTLTDSDGNVIDLSTTSATLVPVTASQYQIVLGTLADNNGIYTLTYHSEGSAVQDISGNEVAGPASETWQKGVEVIAPTAGIQDITPDPRPSGSAVGIVTINFSEDVTGVDISDFQLLLDDGSGPIPISLAALSVSALNASTYQIDLSTVTTQDGDYTLNLLTNGSIQDLAGNTFVAGASDSWRTGGTGPVATIQDLPAILVTNAGIVTVTFDQAVTGVDINDFNLTLNGQNVNLTGLAVVPVSGSQYQIDLTTVTEIYGNYTLTVVAAGSNIRSVSTLDPMLADASESWVASSTIDLASGSPVLTDGVDTVAGDGVVGDGTTGSQTLRAAVQEANALAGSNVIELAAGTYVLSIAGADEDLSATGDLDIKDNLTIRGQGVGVTIIDAGALDRIFQVFAGVTLNLENLTITNGALTGSADGAGIRNSGTTTLTNVEVTGNVSEDSAGGINNTGLMIIVDSTISNNSAVGSGGGIRNTGSLQVTRSTLFGNTTERDGGALFNAATGNVTLSNTTFSGNQAARSGGAIRNTATLSAINNTMTQNIAGTVGGAISNSGIATLQNDLILDNTAGSDADLQGSYNSLGGNLIGVVGTATGLGGTDILGVADPTLVLDSNLADNGGPTLTHALILGSVAIDAGINANTDALEQRGSQRILGSAVDIGAVEYGTFFVNSDLDTVDASIGDGIAADANGNITLRAAIMEANALAGDSLIVLGAGTYALTQTGAGENAALTGDLDITDLTGSLTILGAGSGQTIIDASGLVDDRVFDVLSGTDLTLQGLTVTGGNAVGASGGGIRNVGTLSLVDAAVDGNTAELNGGGILNGELGLQGTLNISNSDVSNNSAVDGAGIYNNDQSQVTIVDSAVTGNTGSGDGAGLYNDLQATINITRSDISGNTAALDGGGVYNNDLASLTITDSKVNNNTANQGGGIFNEEAAALTVSRTTVSGNTSTLGGGGIYNDGGIATLTQVSILTNTAHLDGGGLYNATGGQVTITNGYFDDNSADRDGGSIANYGITLSVSGTTVRDSDALRFGGGLYNDQEEGTVNIFDSSFIKNLAVTGGGIYNQELGVINLDLSNVLQNIATSDGGGIFNTANATITVERTTVDGNNALNGAGIYNDDGAQLNLLDSTVSNNVASGDGGGLYNNSIIQASVVNATISGNGAANNGGGIFNSAEGSVEVTNVTVFNNSSITGGGIFNQVDGFVTVANTIVAGNSTTAPGPDVSGDYNSRGNNLIGVGGISTGFTDGVKGDLVGSFATPISPGLGALQDNGGATFTHELLGGSLARDAGNNFYAPTDDQRGFARLFDGDGNGSLIVDIGAFESGYIVTGFGDSVDAAPGDGVSVDANGQSTLRAAIIEANTRAGADTILLGTGVYTLSLFGQGEDNAYWGDLDITDDLTIIGAGSGKTVIDADNLDRIFEIFGGINVSIRGVTLVNGDVTRVEDGGAILNFGNLTLEDVEIRDSLANRGGALFNNGVVTMTNSFFHDNTAIADGGAIFNNDSGTATIDLSTITGNNAENGGGIYNTTGGTLEVTDTTIDGNTATVAGGGVYNSAEVAVGNGEGGSGGDVPDPDPTPTSQYHIDVVFTDTSLTASQQAIFQQAADRWSEIILGDVPDVIISGIGLVDDLRIEASAPAIDGVGGILGQAGPTAVRTGTFIPATGVMQFDSADVASLEASGQLVDVILHEMGHVIGFGTIWDSLGLIQGAGTAASSFLGTNAIAQYNALLGRSVTAIPLETNGGPGTADAHWSETDLDNELMTGFLNSGVANPISAITIGSLADLGYVVDLGAADSYPLLAPDVQYLTSPEPSQSLGQMLDAGPMIVLGEDAFAGVEAGSGTVTISNSTISNNFAGTRGGGLLNEDPIELSNVTISGNEAGKEGGGIHNSGELTINNTTIYNNTTEGSGGGIHSVADTATVDVKNTIVAGNQALVSGDDVEGVFTSQGHNLIGSRGNSVGFVDGFNSDIVGSDAQHIDPFLSPLQDNGGPTFTHALLPGSLAIDAGDNTDGVDIDQRGALRPTDTTSDIGAYEIVTPTISITDVSQVETNSGTTEFEFVVSLSNANVDEVSVDFETSNGTAVAGIDYAFTTGRVTFSAGETTQVVRVLVNGDTDVEDHETFFVNLFNANGAAIADDQGLGTILNDEASISIDDVSEMEGPVGLSTNFTFTVSLATPVAGVVTVDLQTADGSATLADLDYDQLPLQTITFNPGETEKTVTVVVNGDTAIEADETFSVELSNASSNATIADATGIGTIENDDYALLSISDVTLTENYGGGATTAFTFTVSLSQAAGAPVTVNASTADGTATVGDGDYVSFTNVPINFSATETSKTITVTVNNDGVPNEGNETFYVNLSGAVNANIADGEGLGTIVENGIVVDTTADIVNATDGLTSLREAIDAANASAGVDNIILLPGIYDISIAGGGENNNATGDFDIKDDVNIFGQGAGTTIIDAHQLDRIFETSGGVNLHLSNMELRNGDADDGGAILAQGPTTLNQLIFRNNNADFLGGAIVSASTLDIQDAQFLYNHAGFQGGAIYQYTDTATVGRTTFEGNTSDARAGAVYVAPGATFDVSQSLFYLNASGSRGGAIFNEGTTVSTNTTFSENHSGSRGGAIFNADTLTVINNTLTLNTADSTGGGIANDTGAFVTLFNTIVAGNSAAQGNDDLGGDYDTASSFNNLVGNIDTATGLTDGLNGNIIGSLTSPVDPNLGILLDNGGPTRTHTLLFGSAAIDAGRNNGAPLVDQRGHARPVDGDNDATAITDIGAVELQSPPPAPLYGTGGDSTVVDEQTNIQISVVKDRTVVSSDGHTFALPGNVDWVDEWDSFWVEVWVDTASGFGISDVLTNIAYNTAYFSATSVEFGSNFNFNRTVVIDDEAGVVRNLGGSTIQSNVGGTGYALLARIKFEALANDQVEVDPSDLTLKPLQLGLDVQNTEISVAGVGEVTANVGALPETDLYPVIYDINDDDAIDFRDLTFFVSAYNQKVLNASSEFAAALDFDKSGRVDFKDLTFLATNYNKRKSGNTEVNFPANFGQKWIGTQLEVNSGDDTIDEVVAAAVDTWETALGLDEPLNVQVIVQDFGTAQLGSGQTTEYNVDGVPVAGRVVIDDDANGLGWNVDLTDAPTAGGYDLYTVLLHEIGHVLGFTRYYAGFGNLVQADGSGNLTFVGSDFTVDLDSTGLHIDDPAIADDLMNDTLDPGVRKSISDLDVKMLLEAYASASGGSGSGSPSPIYGTNSVPTSEPVEPTLIQSTEAAQTFVAESTVSMAAPAVITPSKEENTEDGISQTVSFDAIQPSLYDQDLVADRKILDGSLLEDLYSADYEDGLFDLETDDRELVFAHADDELDLGADYQLDQETMDDAFSNWEGPLF
ncbi:choice-of-anchor Q domain-containing protein [Gimesia panareensis]|uniref:choice-of-anchor Q domain-containing protein n=1 Tax=Gimesia panareensis TaxID=2527978 RepID=UPI00118A9183|nr:choice-of-anchor Q domain-containing protein [Gimesia panareensis]QDU51944.1 putative outer membrane protein pmp20 precursor [Gimesia panareensis]